jgi:hypothetical protein
MLGWPAPRAQAGVNQIFIIIKLPDPKPDLVEEEEGLHGVFKRLRRNGHQLEKGCCEQLSSDCHSKRG